MVTWVSPAGHGLCPLAPCLPTFGTQCVLIQWIDTWAHLTQHRPFHMWNPASLVIHDSTMAGLTRLQINQWPDSKPMEAGRQKCRLSARKTETQTFCLNREAMICLCKKWPCELLTSSFYPSVPWSPCRRGELLSFTRQTGLSSVMLGHR